MTARQAALDVLIRVMHKEAYANLCIKDTAPKLPDARERAMLSALVYGVLEKRLHLEYILKSLCNMKKLPHEVEEALYLGAYQMLFMESVPDSAAVSESVKLVRKKNARLSGLVNAVLRNLARMKDPLKLPEDALTAHSLKFNLPSHLAKRHMDVFGVDAQIPDLRRVGVRLRDASKKEALLALFKEQNAEVEQLWDTCFCVRGGGDLVASDLYQEGAFVIQSASSQLIAKAVGAEAGMRVLDTCAAPGGKSFAVADGMGDGAVLSLDLHDHRAKLIAREAKRLGILIVEARQADATKLSASLYESFDAVLVDAPCSGLSAQGKPEIPLRLTDADIRSLADVQAKILREAAKCVKKGGVLLYSTCTWTREENELQVERFLRENPEFSCGNLGAYLPEQFSQYVTDDTMLRLDSVRDGMPSFFMARFVKK